MPRVGRLGGLFDLALFHFLAEPLAVMAPAPAAGHRAASHGADGATHPDRRIDVDNPDCDGENGRDGVDQGSPALLLDRRLEP